MTTLMERQRIYTQRYTAKMKEIHGEDYLIKKKNYMKSYRDKRNEKEGYEKPEPVEKIIEQTKEPEITKEIILKQVKKSNKKDIVNVAIARNKLSNTKLSDTTIKGYISTISSIHKLIKNETLGKYKQQIIKAILGQSYDKELETFLSYLKKDNLLNVIDTLRKKYNNDNSFKQKIVSLTSILGRLNNFDEEYKYLSDIGISLQEDYTKKRDLNEISKEDLDTINSISFNIKDIINNLEKIDDRNKQVLYAIYMLIPRRLEVREVKIRTSLTDKDKGNYLIVNDFKDLIPEYFVFNSYKTQNSYNRQLEDVPDDIQPYLHEYLLEQNFKNNEYLFHLQRSKKEAYDEGFFSKLFQQTFYDVYNKKITNQLLRIAYATYFTGKAKNIKEKKEISTKLSHSIYQNEQYIKLNVLDD
jgi:hypothetical protein